MVAVAHELPNTGYADEPDDMRGDPVRSGKPRITSGENAAGVSSSKGPTLDLRRNVPALLVFLANKLTTSASGLYREHFGVGTTEWRIMALLAIEPDIAAKRICEVIGFDKAAVSRTLKVLDDRGLISVRPLPNNSRSAALTLTARGRKLHDRIIMIALERERRLLSCLAPDEVEHLIDMLNRMHAGLGAVDRPIDIPPAKS
jgi:DNA-binding MarR family transcriptional regulator